MEAIVALGLALGLISFFQCMCLNCMCHSLNKVDDRLEKLEKTYPVRTIHRRPHINPIHIHVDEDPEPCSTGPHV